MKLHPGGLDGTISTAIVPDRTRNSADKPRPCLSAILVTFYTTE